MKNIKIPRVLIIAGSDSSGGAGIQADIKTCAAFGVYAATAITAVTAQNTMGVQHVEALSADLVAAQMQSVLSDIGADVIKIGMLANADIIKAVAEVIINDAEDCTVVLDPVMVATSGDKLLEDDAVNALKELLIPLADVVTPNIDEAEILTGLRTEDASGLIAAGEQLLKMGTFSALMKGGHLSGKSITDVLVAPDGNHIMSAPRIHSRHTHGTGCTLASSVASLLAQGAALEVAVREAREFVFEAIRTAPKLGKGNGPLNHGLLNQGIGSSETEGAPKADANNPFAALKDM
jgi:hydroxymethylpyrimidine/phosphomethylpyrimidine kinase